MKYVVKLVCFVVLLQLTEAACKGNWTNFGGHCYHFSHDEEEWVNAKFLCSLWNSKLASIDSPEEQIFIQQKAVEVNVGDYWLGATDFDQQGTWVWQDGSDIVFSNWDLGEPDNHHQDESCMAMDKSAHYAWVDKTCKDELGYVCEKPEDSSPAGIIG